MTRPILIFDLDGTLADPREGITRCMRHALESVGAAAPIDADLAHYIGPPLADIFFSILGDYHSAQRAVSAYREHYGLDGLYEAHLYEGIADALARLQALSPAMFVASSKPRVFAERIVEHFRLTSFFRAVYGCELTGERANKAELIQHLIEREALAGADMVMIGDRKHDVIGARANGIRSVAVAWGFGSLEELTEAGPEMICSTVEDLVQWYLAAGGYNPPSSP